MEIDIPCEITIQDEEIVIKNFKKFECEMHIKRLNKKNKDNGVIKPFQKIKKTFKRKNR